MNDPAFKLLERLCIKVYLQIHRLGLGELTTLQISFSSHTALFLSSDEFHTVFKDKVSECRECIYCYAYMFLSLKKLHRDKNVCLWKVKGRLIRIFNNS